MKQAVVITTINSETAAMLAFKSLLDSWSFVIVSDQKTPPETAYLSVEEQTDLGYSLTDHLPFNHYSRKNIGYLRALEEGAELIYDTDDDNTPYKDWSYPTHHDYLGEIYSGKKYVNVYQSFTKANIWPRGYPLRWIRDRDPHAMSNGRRDIGVWQGLADLDPDVDAIYRLVNEEGLKFDKSAPIVLDRNTYCPFNSQNTLWIRKAMPYAYLPISVSFRFTDILRGYIAQRCMWEHGLHLGFTRSTVYQERNDHDLLVDLKDELECYFNVESIVAILDGLILRDDYEYNLMTCYNALCKSGYVKEAEINTVKKWIEDINNLF